MIDITEGYVDCQKSKLIHRKLIGSYVEYASAMHIHRVVTVLKLYTSANFSSIDS